jgi:hypothetical protein
MLEPISRQDIIDFLNNGYVQTAVVAIFGVIYLAFKKRLWPYIKEKLQIAVLRLLRAPNIFSVVVKRIIRKAVFEIINEPKVIFESDFTDKSQWHLNHLKTQNHHDFSWTGKLIMESDGQERDGVIRTLSHTLFEVDRAYETTVVVRSKLFTKTIFSSSMECRGTKTTTGDLSLGWRYRKISHTWWADQPGYTKVIFLVCSVGACTVKSVHIRSASSSSH